MQVMRRDPALLATAFFLFLVVAVPARAGGGFTPLSWGSAAVALSAFALAGLLAREVRIGELELLVGVAFTLFAAWTALSLLWTSSVPLSMLASEHALLPLAGLAAAVIGVRVGAAPALGVVVFALSLVLACQALIAGVDAPLGYSNSLALLCVVGILLAGGWALERRTAGALVVVPVLCVFAAVIVQTDSRGAWVALLGGVAVAAGLLSRRPVPATFGALGVAGATIALLGVSESAQRAAYWETTLRQIARNPFLGTGAGTWHRVWLEHRDVDLAAQNAHSLYLEVLSELGPVGLSLLLVGLLVPLVAAIQARRQPYVPALAGAYAAVLLHLAVDWDWQISAVLISEIFLGAALLGLARSSVAAPPGRRVRQAVAVPALVLLIAVCGVIWAGAYVTARAEGHLRTANWTAALAEAKRAHWLAPWSSEPWRLRGEAQLALGRPDQALLSFRKGLDLDRDDVVLWRALSGVASGAERSLAQERVAQLDPRGLENERPTG